MMKFSSIRHVQFLICQYALQFVLELLSYLLVQLIQLPMVVHHRLTIEEFVWDRLLLLQEVMLVLEVDPFHNQFKVTKYT